MKANEFVKRFGLERAKQFVNADHTAHALVFATTGVSFIDLKRLVESWELVEKLGGLENAKDEYFSCVQNNEPASYIAKAIIEVESCNE